MSNENPQDQAAQRSAQSEAVPKDNITIDTPIETVNTSIATPVVGRPTKYTETLQDSIMADVAASPDSIATISKRHGINPDTFWLWVRDNPLFSDAFMQARSLRAHSLVHGDAEKLTELEIKAETASNEELRRIDLQSRIHRIRIGRNQWMAERMNPRQFASQQHVDVTQRSLNVHLHADTPEDVQAMAAKLEGLEDAPT